LLLLVLINHEFKNKRKESNDKKIIEETLKEKVRNSIIIDYNIADKSLFSNFDNINFMKENSSKKSNKDKNDEDSSSVNS
jgi:hypothetical protein